MLIHGPRRIKEGMVDQFKESYGAFARSLYDNDPNVKAVFAFPDKVDPLVYWHVFCSNDLSSFAEPAVDPAITTQLWTTYTSTAKDQDSLEVYGAWSDGVVKEIKKLPSVCYNFHDPLAGFIKENGCGQGGPPMFGFTKRHVKPGKVEELAATFQKVCDLWYKIPGILAASVSRDKEDPSMVHDIRIFANYDSYLSHVDKTNIELTAAMEAWFENYDNSIPFTGELYVANTTEAMQSSSIKSSTTVRPNLCMFHYGPDQLGPMPDMNKSADRKEA